LKIYCAKLFSISTFNFRVQLESHRFYNRFFYCRKRWMGGLQHL